MNERILNLLSLCLQAKEKGHDCFFDLQAHVGVVYVISYENGWKAYKEVNKRFCLRIDGTVFEDCWQGIDEVETYLKGLIA